MKRACKIIDIQLIPYFNWEVDDYLTNPMLHRHCEMRLSICRPIYGTAKDKKLFSHSLFSLGVKIPPKQRAGIQLIVKS